MICLKCIPKFEGAARGLREYISGKSRAPMLQLLCNTSEANSLMPIRIHPLGSLCMPERSNYGYAASNVVAMIVIINGPVLQMPESPVGEISWKIHHSVLFED